MVASAWNDDELLSLFARVCDGRADLDETRQVDARLASDPRARQLWLEYVSVHGGVAQHLDAKVSLVDWQRVFHADEVGSAISLRQLQPPEAPAAKTVRSSLWTAARAIRDFARRYPVISCAAAVLVVGLGVALLSMVYFPEGRIAAFVDPEPELVARLTSTVDTTWATGQIGAALGSHVQSGQLYRLQSGVAQFTFASGTKVVLEGPAEFRLSSVNSGFLLSGKLAANVPPRAKGFTIQTKNGRVVDLGTRFAVEVSPERGTAVHCFRGKVLYAAPSIETVRLSAGQAIEHFAGSPRKVVVNASAFVHDTRLRGSLRQNSQGLVVDQRFVQNAALGKPVTQSTTHGSFAAECAVDGDPRNFTHTTYADKDPWLMVDLLGVHDIDAVIVHNRDECCGERLRDIVVEILGEDGQTVVYASPKLNENDALKQPPLLAVGLPEATGDVVHGRYVRIRRQIIPSNATDDATLAGQRVLSIGEVQIFAAPSAAPPAPKSTSAPADKSSLP